MPFRRSGFSPDFAVTTTGICNPDRSTGPHGPASAQSGRPPTGLRPEAQLCGIGGRLRPVHLRGLKPRRVSCYALFKGWLLLSLPPRCFRLETPFGLSLSRHLGALTTVRVVPLSEHELNPCIPPPGFYGAGVFGVQRGGEASRPPASRLVLYPAGSLPRGYAATYFGGN